MSFYGTDPLSRYQRSLGPQGERPSSRSISGYDAFGNPLRGQYVSGDAAFARSQDRLFAQLSGATAQQLLGPVAGVRNTVYLRPEQMEALARSRRSVGGSEGSSAATAANLSAPGMGLPLSPPDASGMGVPKSLSPQVLAFAALAALAIALALRGR